MNSPSNLTPSAKRLISSMRDLGYEFADAVAEIVDNSIQAGANVIQVNLQFDGYDSYLTVLDNGVGMTPSEIREAMRFGSMRDYEQDDLGKFGLGLKTSSLSQCDSLTVSSRNSEKKVQLHSYSWDMDHINKVDRWEILPIEIDDLLNPVVEHLYSTTGTAVTWEKLNRLLNFQNPAGGRAENDFKKLIQDLKVSLGATFHRYLTGEQRSKKVMIFVNGDLVESWDPFCRTEKNTVELESFAIPISMDGKKGLVKFRPFVLPAQSQFSSSSAHLRAGGPAKWNKQQGFYIYRAGRLLQSGGWCGLRTSDEHSKLARVLVEIPAGFDDLFKVNISKMKINFPREMREETMHKLAPTLKKANDSYRTQGEASFSDTSVYEADDKQFEMLVSNSLSKLDSDWHLSPGTVGNVLPKLYGQATPSERRYLLRIFKRLAGEEKISEKTAV
ncbi:ATP-binding protein [Polynucleobacter sp. MG-28-Ekke-A2]|uniref:ATP-binding protein n=1 Tax=Polynucleobacter sp. MG-28-Ekke-A2 TaxID=3108276 RepID=UPI002B233C38|nr:ATP-binding protein [Polynucleobacter sp. MG-28-Ekke-A2]MEA9602424.1 ATP-binding protein [Polynucleobacter sp. MG-28-Ekke-A2]